MLVVYTHQRKLIKAGPRLVTDSSIERKMSLYVEYLCIID